MMESLALHHGSSPSFVVLGISSNLDSSHFSHPQTRSHELLPRQATQETRDTVFMLSMIYSICHEETSPGDRESAQHQLTSERTGQPGKQSEVRTACFRKGCLVCNSGELKRYVWGARNIQAGSPAAHRNPAPQAPARLVWVSGSWWPAQRGRSLCLIP